MSRTVSARSLPGLRPHRKKQWLAGVRDKILSGTDLLSAEEIVKSWTEGAASNVNLLSGLLTTFAGAMVPKANSD
jgi:hypothetical protein